MSDLLTDSAPVAPVEVPSVEDQATQAGVEVDAGSGSDENSVPVERFNGLMSTLGKTQSDLSAKEAELESLREQLAAAQTQLGGPTSTQEENSVPEAETPIDDSTAALKAELDELKGMLGQLVQGTQEDRLNTVRQSVLNDFPDVAPFADLIVADDEASFREVAQDIAARVQQVKGAGAPATETEQEPAPSGAPGGSNPLVVTSAGPPPGEPSKDDAVKEALQKGDFHAWAKLRHGAGADDQGLVLSQ